ncbi:MULTISPECIES: HAD family hydrolase [unclassified Mesorhizobium]|uniref:HAD family hydrolase n=1 Tax=unclassified Mesorhizobium TaxID=325217 RepID=UPI000FD9C151|nr:MULTISPECIES: HAD family hydrolase [unclassified Mesorhizobium]TGQ40677.1 HAD family hydrolase [Mesorhizobium sp. M00.F.Ca.ET.216.01.1.1]TIS60364.1 MAG: HAD family hydrolase [Mesorhizobium sp.]TIS91436.1 MAG: HAD family hydrolase [Mesorhizobium sp.]TJW13983.1 MAG: HAD family hydrolase [Mesorhizobium sp.]TJW44652.1 MAG: HAD family hydrolase [Mesorhizobium sp.]
MTLPNGPVEWDQIRLAVFDLDGTLYDQRRLRAVMLLRLALHAANSRSLAVLQVLKAFRDCREKLGETLATDFATQQYELTAHRTGRSVDAVKAIVEEWIDRRPLDVLRGCRYRGVERVFTALMAQRKTLAVLSDYPAREKLQALGLSADIIVSSGDPDVGVLKPHPAGLQRVLDRAGVPAQAAIMIGDRVDRDWAVAKQHGMRALIRSRNPITGIDTFRDYEDEAFQPLIGRATNK